MLINRARSLTTKALAWLSLILTAIGGCAASAIFIGTVIATPLEFVWHWLPPVLVFIGFVFMVIDLSDWVPDLIAVVYVLLLPSVATEIPGKAGVAVNSWIDAVNKWMGDLMTDFFAGVSMLAICIVCSACGLKLAMRVYGKSFGASAPTRAPAGAGAR